MCAESDIMRATQLTVRHAMDDTGKPLKVYAYDAGIKESTFMSYFKLEGMRAVVPVTALRKLCGVLPEQVLSLFLPDGFQIVRAPEVIDYDLVAEKARAFLAIKDATHHPDSPDKRDISECEAEKLSAASAELKAVA